MKKVYLYKISLVIALSIISVSASAQGRPVWIIGHGANWVNSLKAALDHGANGVEIDVRTKGKSISEDRKGEHWSIGHDAYHREVDCDKLEEGNNMNMSLKWFLTKQSLLNDPRFCILWIDCKNEQYIKELVEYVHRYTPSGTPYAIIYNMYDLDTQSATLEWLGKNLRDNEGINWGDREVSKLKAHINGKIPANKHFYTMGYFRTRDITRGSDRANNIRQAMSLANKGEFCCRAGIWTCDTAWETYFWLYNEKNSNKYPTNFDLVLSYFEEGYIPPLCRPSSLRKCINDKFYNKKSSKDGRMHIAGRDEPFYKK